MGADAIDQVGFPIIKQITGFWEEEEECVA